MLEAVAGECELVGRRGHRLRGARRPRERSAAAAVALDVLEPLLRRDLRGGPCPRLSPRRPPPADTLVARPPLRELVDDLHERREQARQGGGPEKIERQHAARQAHRPRAAGAALRRGQFTELGIHGRPHFSQRAMEGKEAPADGVVTGYGKVDGRLVAVCRLRLHRHGRLDGHDRRAEGHAPARAGAREADPVASGCSTPPARGSRRRPARCSPARATCSARRSR